MGFIMPDMRFAPPNPIRIADRANGLNAVSVRSHNERLVLALLLQHGGISRMAIGEKTGLSAQTVSVIVRSLEQEGLVAKGLAQKGRVGPPTIPMSLNPDGAYSIGVSIGFRKTEIVLIDFVGEIIESIYLRHDAPGWHYVHPQLFSTIETLINGLSRSKKHKIAGVGLALPSTFEDSDELEVFKADVERELNLEVFVQDDVTSAANGESMFGHARDLDNYLFFYIGAQVHSRLILNHQIFKSGSNAIYDVGLVHFERALGANSTSVEEIWQKSAGLANYEPALERWTEECVALISTKVAEAQQFVDVSTVVLSTYTPPEICERICSLLSASTEGLAAITGKLANAPKAVGAASLPYSSRFMV
tara:strand:+ start:3034 stop:4122 length:1089 start_codon:yes stop_codon:yes gene_type:complete